MTTASAAGHTASDTPHSDKKRMRKVMMASTIGNALEWYDFALYGHFAVLLSRLFFPADSDPTVALILTFGTFAAGFAMRPIGAILFGYIGDHYGRRASLSIALLMMAVPTACIGLLPTYAQIGIAAPILLTVIRLLQGLSLGGAFSGSIAFIVEHSEGNRRGVAGSASMLSLVIGMLMGSVVATIFAETLSTEAFESWGWRIPFIIGVLIGVTGFYIRHATEESPKYLHAKEAGHLSERPLRETLTTHRGALFQAIGIYLTVTVPFYMFMVFMLSFFQTVVMLPMKEALLINTIGMFVVMFLIIPAAKLSDRIGRKPVLAAGAIALMIFAYPIFYVTLHYGFWGAMVAQIVFAMILGVYLAPVPAVLVELFPTSVRSTGMAISYNICAALFGGTVPMLSTWLIKATGIQEVMAFYLIGCALISLVTLKFYKDRYQEAID